MFNSRKVFAALLASASIVTITLSSVVNADGDKTIQYGNGYSSIKYVLSDSEVTITGFEIVDTSFDIPSEIDGLPVTRIVGDNITEKAYYLEEISIPDTVVTCCLNLSNSNLSSISIPDSVKYLNLSCADIDTLTAVNIGNGVETLENSSFRNCTALTDVTIPENISVGKRTFENTPLTNNQTGVIYVGNWVTCCDNTVTDVTIKEGTAGIANGAFEDCDKLRSISISEGVKKLDSRTFKNCTSLESVIMPESLTTINNSVFDGCAALENIVFSSQLSGIKDQLKDTFYYQNQVGLKYVNDKIIIGCDSGMTNITIPNGIERINDFAFTDNPELEKITFPDSLKSIGTDAFHKTTYETYDENYNVNELYINDWCIHANTSRETVEIKDGTVGIAAFAVDSDKVKKVIIPEGVKYLSNSAISVREADVYIPRSVSEIEFNGVHSGVNNSIYGYMGTAAETYAKNAIPPIPFVALDSDEPIVTDTTAITNIQDVPAFTTNIKTTVSTNKVSTASTTTTALITTTTAAYEPGDINMDSKVDLRDAIYAAECLIGKHKDELTERKIKIADFNENGRIDLYDVIAIAKAILKNNKLQLS